MYNRNPIFITHHDSLHKQKFYPYRLHWNHHTYVIKNYLDTKIATKIKDLMAEFKESGKYKKAKFK